MANIKSARKRAHQAQVRRVHNMSLRTAVRTAIKNVKKAVAGGDKAAAESCCARRSASSTAWSPRACCTGTRATATRAGSRTRLRP